MKLEPNAPDLAEFVKSLIDEIGRLEEENHRLRLAMALRAWKPSPKRRGRPVKYSIEEDIRLLAMVEKLQKRMSIKTRMGVLRWFMEKNPNKPVNELKQTKELESLNKVLSDAKRERDKQESKSSSK